MPNWEGSGRRHTLPADWAVRQLTTLRRDHHRCQHIREDTQRKCARRANHVDHIIPYSQGGTDEYSNLQSLCDWHHNRKSGSEGGKASAIVHKAKREAAKPMHPGLMPTHIAEPAPPQTDQDAPPF